MVSTRVLIGLAVVVILLGVGYYVWYGSTHWTAVGNNGAMPCSAYCAMNWGNEMPKAWKGAVATSQRNATTGASLNPPTSSPNGTAVKCVCKRSDSTPYIQMSPWACPGKDPKTGIAPPCTLPGCAATMCT